MCIMQWEVGQIEFSKNTQKHVFCSLSLNISYKIHLFPGENFGGTRHLCEPTLDGLVKACWLMSYIVLYCIVL